MTAMAEEMERQRDLPGDSDEDDMGDEELEELFGPDAVPGRGADAVDPIDLEADGTGAEAGDGDDDDHLSRPSTSDVWNDFKKLFKMGPKGKEIRYGAICIHCKKQYSGRSASGTGHLRRHRDKCAKRKEKIRGV